MMIKIIPFDTGHVSVMEMDDDEVGYITKLSDCPQRFEILKENSTQSVTFIRDGRVLCCTGFMSLWPGVMEAWILPSMYIFEYAIEYGKTIRRYIDNIFLTFNCHRIQSVAIHDERHLKWMKFLGFECEGILRKYTHEQNDFAIFAKV